MTPAHQPSPWRPPTLLPAPAVAVITARQAQILVGICRGHTHGQIASRLGISEQGARHTASRLFVALGARDRAHAAALTCSGQVAVYVRGKR